jgi:hypothetical protein
MNLLGLHNIFKLPLTPCGLFVAAMSTVASCVVVVYCVGVM